MRIKQQHREQEPVVNGDRHTTVLRTPRRTLTPRRTPTPHHLPNITIIIIILTTIINRVRTSTRTTSSRRRVLGLSDRHRYRELANAQGASLMARGMLVVGEVGHGIHHRDIAHRRTAVVTGTVGGGTALTMEAQ